jgi:hypothetical protein
MKTIFLFLAASTAFAQLIGGPTQARKVVNTTCTSGQVPTYDAFGRQSGCAANGGSPIAFAAPYMVVGGVSYLPGGFPAVLPPAVGAWTARGTGTAVSFAAAGSGGAINLTSSNAATTSQARAIPVGATRTLTLALAVNMFTGGACGAGVARPGTSGAAASIFYVEGNSPPRIVVDLLNGSFQYTASAAGVSTSPHPASALLYLRINATGSNVVMSRSNDNGLTWINFWTGTQTTVLGGAITSTDEWFFSATGSTTISSSCTLVSWSAQ